MSVSVPSAVLVILASLALPINAQNKEVGVLFQERIGAYVKLHKDVEAHVHKLKPTPSAEELAENKRLLADGIRKARDGAKQGDIFTPEIAAEYRNLAQVAMKGANGPRVHKSLNRAEPVQVPIRVNEDYPSGVPLQSMPPTLLLNLPKLPKDLEYRLSGRTLILRDVDANLIIDFLPEAIP